MLLLFFILLCPSSAVRSIHEQDVSITSVAGASRMQCEESGYCSLGRVKPWKGEGMHPMRMASEHGNFNLSDHGSGDVWPSAGLVASVRARSYKNELILMGESRGNPFLQVGWGRLAWKFPGVCSSKLNSLQKIKNKCLIN